MKYKSRKDGLFTTVILLTNALLIVTILYTLSKDELAQSDYLMVIPLFAVVSLQFWIFFGTSYELTKETFSYRCGPFNGNLPIESIYEIVKGETLWVGTKPATAKGGLIIKYNKYDEIYISPDSNESFINQILKIKDDIKISS